MIAASLDHELDELIAANREAWLREAEATLVELDPHGFAAGTLHVLDFTELGAPAEGYLGFTAGAQLHELIADRLPRHAAAAVAVNVDRIARTRSAVDASAERGAMPGTIRAAVAAIAAHELAHVLDALAAGDRLPPGTTLASIVGSLTTGRAAAEARGSTMHSPGWLRAYLHLLTRASSRHDADAWLSGFVRDVHAVMPHSASAYFDALRPELIRCRRDARLVEILREPAPPDFLSLFDRTSPKRKP